MCMVPRVMSKFAIKGLVVPSAALCASGSMHIVHAGELHGDNQGEDEF